MKRILSIGICITIIFKFSVQQTSAQIKEPKEYVVQKRNEICKAKPYINLNLVEINTSINSLNGIEKIDTVHTQMVMNSSQFLLWVSKRNKDIIVINGKSYEFFHSSKSYRVSDFIGNFEDITGRIATQYLDSFTECPSYENYELIDFSIHSDTVSYKFFRNGGLTDSLYISESICNGRLLATSQEFLMNGVKFKHKAFLNKLEIGSLDSLEFLSNLKDWILSRENEYAIISPIPRIEGALDSTCFNGDLPFYDLENNKFPGLSQNEPSIFIFSFVGCVPCAMLKHQISEFMDSSFSKFQVYIVNSTDSNDRIYKEMEKYSKSIHYLMLDASIEKSRFNISGYPTSFIVNKRGNILYHKKGFNVEMIDEIKLVLKP